MSEQRGPASQGAAEGRSGAMSPVAAFALIVGFLAVMATAFYLTRPDVSSPAPSPPASPTVETSLTESEAIATFKRLDNIRLRAYRTNDVALLSKALLQGSAISERVTGEIQQLIEDKVVARPRVETRRLTVEALETNEVILRQTVLFDLRFVNARGKDVTSGGGVERQVVIWTLQREGDKWLISEAQIVQAERVRRDDT